jgi:hypothetical protein
MLAPYLPAECAQLVECYLDLFSLGWFAFHIGDARWRTMPFEVALHITDTFTGDSSRNDNTGTIKYCLGSTNRFYYRLKVVTIYFLDMPAKTFETMCEWFHRYDVFCITVYLYIIPIYHKYKFAKPLLASKHDSLPV